MSDAPGTSSRLSRLLLWNPQLSRLRRGVLGALESLLARKYAYISFHSDQRRVFDLIREVKARTGMLISDQEAFQLWTAASSAALSIPGNFAEFGVYNGGSAKLLSEIKGEGRALHLFDSFEGLPKLGPKDDGWEEGWFRGSREGVEMLLGKYPKIHIHQGLFPTTAEPVRDEKFAFVHLDVDIYQSTLDGLEFFYPRLSPGGLLLSHDYQPGSAVAEAFDRYFLGKNVAIVPLPPRYVMVVGN